MLNLNPIARAVLEAVRAEKEKEAQQHEPLMREDDPRVAGKEAAQAEAHSKRFSGI